VGNLLKDAVDASSRFDPTRLGYSTTMSTTDPEQEERFAEPRADRPPTEEEERAAERGAEQVDLDDVSEHEREMAVIGKNVKGEGDLFPSD
jgi:hypothetical protein